MLTDRAVCFRILIMKTIKVSKTAYRLALLLLTAALALSMTACSHASAAVESALQEEDAAVSPSGEASAAPEDGVVSVDLNVRTDASDSAVWTDSAELTLSAAGDYRLSGSLEGSVVVNADGPVTLILDGVYLIGQDCLNVRSGDPVTILGAEGTENILSDVPFDPSVGEPGSGEASETSSGETSGEAADAGAGSSDADTDTAEEADASGAVVTSKAPLTFTSGSVTVNADINNGVRAKDGLTVQGGSLTVTAAHHGVKADGVISVLAGTLDVTAGGDALCAEAGRIAAGAVEISGGSTVLTAAGRGVDAENLALFAGGELTVVSDDDGVRADTISVTGGVLDLTAGCDGLQAGAQLTVENGELTVTTGAGGGKAINHAGESFGSPWGQSSDSSSDDSVSQKGLKSDGSITVTGGTISLYTDDDAVHCAQVFTMDGGSVSIVSNNDGIHADDMLVVSGGRVELLDCFEGLEAFAVEIRGGDVFIRSVNDGVNASGSTSFSRGSSASGEAGSTSASGATRTYFLMSGGTLDLAVTGNNDNMGDGVDSNGAVYITGGTAVISTIGSFMENGLDTGSGGPVVTGGAVMAGGASSMAEGFSSSSTQCCAIVSTRSMPAGTEVTLSDEDGNIIWSVTMANTFSCLQVSHPDMQPGRVYTLTYGTQTTTLDFTNTTNISKSGGGGGFGGFR